MTTFVQPLLAVAACTAMALTSCAGKRISDIDAPAAGSSATGSAWTVPDGVVTTAAQKGSGAIDGLYPSTVPNDRRCCWLANLASVAIAPPDDVRALRIDVLVPDYPFFEAHPQTLTVLAGTHRETYTDLRPGVHRLKFGEFPSSAERLGETTHLDFVTKFAFVPAREHVNGDTRTLGIILLGLRYDAP